MLSWLFWRTKTVKLLTVSHIFAVIQCYCFKLLINLRMNDWWKVNSMERFIAQIPFFQLFFFLTSQFSTAHFFFWTYFVSQSLSTFVTSDVKLYVLFRCSFWISTKLFNQWCYLHYPFTICQFTLLMLFVKYTTIKTLKIYVI